MVQCLLVDFQEMLRSKHRTRKSAFDNLGGSDDARIDAEEFCAYLKGEGYTNGNLNQQLFTQLDADHDGYISRVEFKQLFEKNNSELDEFQEALKEVFKSRKDAFDKLGGQNDGKIDRDEFQEFLHKHMGFHDRRKNSRLFDLIDDDHNELITNAEFRALFATDGEVATVMEFKDAIRQACHNRKDAFKKLGGSDDARIDRDEFEQFLIEELKYGDSKLIGQLFDLIDEDQSGYISKGEFEALFLNQTAKVVELKDSLKERLHAKFKSRKEAFNKLGGEDDAQICIEEFQEFMETEMGHRNAAESRQLFSWIDVDNDGYITKKEFKDFF